MKLYEITSKALKLFDSEDITDEQYQERESEIVELLNSKSENLIGFVRNKQSDIDALSREIDRLRIKKDAEEKKLKNFTEYVKRNMEVMGVKKVDTKIGTLSLAKNPASVRIVYPEKVPEEWIKYKMTAEPHKQAILQNFKETGEVIPGCEIVTDGTSLRIR